MTVEFSFSFHHCTSDNAGGPNKKQPYTPVNLRFAICSFVNNTHILSNRILRCIYFYIWREKSHRHLIILALCS